MPRSPGLPRPRSDAFRKLLLAERAVDLQRSYIVPSGGARAERVNELLDQMEDRATTELQAAGVSRGEIAFDRYLNVCYPGQTFDLHGNYVVTLS